jgi:GT2 family glycosyltransferase/glycosyltransferase involved in cell wall biosynthesis
MEATKMKTGNSRLVHIIIPVYNKVEFTIKCVKSILANTKYVSYEIIIVDNASTDNTEILFKNFIHPNIKYIRSPINLGFVGGCNLGAMYASGDYLVFLNNDTEVRKGWLKALLDTFENNDDCGAVGCKLVYPDGKLQEAGGIIFSDGSGWNYGRGMDPNDPKFNFVREVDYCSGAALMVRKDLWDQIGGFDDRFAPAYYEDTDLCFEIRRRGYKVYYQPKSVVVHHEGVTAGTDITSSFKRYQLINREKFCEKWKEELKKQPNHPRNLKDLMRASERCKGLWILVADYTFPMYDRAAGSLRLFNILKLLKDMDFHVTFLALNNIMEKKYRPILHDLGIETVTLQNFALAKSWRKAFFEFLSERAFDYALVEFWHLGAQIVPFLKAYSRLTKIIIDTVDVHFVREIREAEIMKNENIMRKALENKRKEILTYKKMADRIWVVTEEDGKVLNEYVSKIPIDIVPTVHTPVNLEKKFDMTSDLLFVGNFSHPPNRDAVMFLCREIFPEIKKVIKNIRLYIVGNNPQQDIKALSSEDIVVTGYVEDLTPYLLKARISVAPLRYGAGMKGKIGEALSFGLPVVTTPIGAEGMNIVHGVHALIAETKDEFVDYVIRLYSDRALWENLSINGKKLIENRYSPAVVRDILQKVFYGQ